MKTRVSYGCGLVGFRPVGISVGASGPAVPGPLTGLSAVFNDPDVDLTWNASSGADSYRIERSAAGAGSWSTLEAAEATTAYTDVAPGSGLFDYRVTPVNTEGDGTAAIAEDVATAAAADLQGLAVTFDADSGNLTWTASAYAASYKIERRDSDVGSGAGSYSTLAAAHTTNSYEDATISGSTSAFDTAYDYRVTPQNSHTNGAAQESVYRLYASTTPFVSFPAFNNCEIEAWGGGGGGGGYGAGVGGCGGGGGGYWHNTTFSYVGGTPTVTIGPGGAGGAPFGIGGAGTLTTIDIGGIGTAGGGGGGSQDVNGAGGSGDTTSGGTGEAGFALGAGGAGGDGGGASGTGGAGGEIDEDGDPGTVPGGGGGGGGHFDVLGGSGGSGASGLLKMRYITPPTA